MRRLAFVVVLATSMVLVSAPPSSARCSAERFDTAVRLSQAVWWATVTGTEHRWHDPQHRGGWVLEVRLREVLKGPGSVGDSRLAFPIHCSSWGLSKELAERYVGQTLLFMGRWDGDVLIPVTQVLIPQNLSPAQRYERARAVLIASQSADGGRWNSPMWIAVATVVVLGAIVVFAIGRRRDPNPT